MGKRRLHPPIERTRSGGVTARSGRVSADTGSVKEARSALAACIRARLPKLQAGIATRVYAISDPRNVADPAYPERLDAAVADAVEYRLVVLEVGERYAPAVPSALLAQARLDARDGVRLDAVLRRYVASSALFADSIAEEAERAGVPSAALRRLLAEQAALGDRLLAAVSEEHAREARERPSTTAERRRECVKSLLAGRLVDHAELGYELDTHHLALIAKGEGGEQLLRQLSGTFERPLLIVQREEEPVWAGWLGGRGRLDADQAVSALAGAVPEHVFVTIGEPGEQLAGWRFSHHQAKAALPIAERRQRRVLRYADVALLASVFRDELGAASLRQLYLEPLEAASDGGATARATLRAYFAAERNISSTAAALGVDRRTVRNRLSAIEERIGRPLKGSTAELEVALRLAD